MHYSGDTKHVADLLNDYFTSPTITRNQANIHRVTQLLTVFPNRDMSRLIFDVIQTHLIATPSLLDDTVLTHMAAFHARTLQHKSSPIEQELTVIKHFGQQKQYDVVFNACRILLQKPTNTRLQQKLIQQIQTEARVERELAPQVNRWYFSIWAFFKRGWNYWGNKPSSYVKFCDDPTPYEAACEIPGRIHTSVLGGDTITQQHTLHQYSKQAQQLKVRVDAMTSERDRLSGSHKQNTEDSSISNQGLFSSKEMVILNPMHDAPASNQNTM